MFSLHLEDVYPYTILSLRASLVAQQERIYLEIQEREVLSLGGEDPLEKEVATHSSILAWEISWKEEPGGLKSIESQRSWIQLSN